MLRKARERDGRSLDEVADHLGITTASLSRMETGVSGVDADRVQVLAKLYGISIADLYEGQLVSMPSTVDVKRMRGVVLLVQQTIQSLRVKPTPEKIAETTTEVYEREIKRLLDDPKADTGFNPEFHRSFVETVFRK